MGSKLVGLAVAMVVATGALCASQVWALNVTATSDPTALANTILGTGITLVGTPTFTGASGAAGAFSGGAASGITINQGIILTTGQAADAIGPNKSDSTSTDNGMPGDPRLTALDAEGFPTFDAAILGIDFQTAGGSLYFNYVFASEEYNEWVGTPYDDVFAFWLDGVNLAVLPNNEPVDINNVDLLKNANLYVNNELSIGAPHNIEYDGFTVPLTVQALNLAPGTHHIDLAIADASDAVWDSAVFIQGGTFSDRREPPEFDAVPDPASLWSLGAAASCLFGLGTLFRRRC